MPSFSIPAVPSVDLSKLDLSKVDLSKLDISKLDLSKLDLSKFEVAGLDTDKLLGVLRDAAYVFIGFGVLTVQQLQVRRREFVSTVESRVGKLGVGKDQIDDVVKQLEQQLDEVQAKLTTLETKLDTAIESMIGVVGERLPDQAGAFLGQAHEVAKAARKQVRGLLVNAA